MLFSANRFKNLCPEYVAEAVAQQNLAAAKAEAEKQNMDKFNVQQTTSPGKEGADDPAPNASHVVSPTDQQQEGVIGDFIGGAVNGVKNFFSGNKSNSQATTSEPSSSSIDFGEKPKVEKISTGNEKLDANVSFTQNAPTSVPASDDKLVVAGKFEFPNEATEEKAEPIDVNITATDAKSGDNAGPVNVTIKANEDIPGRKVEEAADVSEPEEVDFVSEAAYIDYLLESLDETEE